MAKAPLRKEAGQSVEEMTAQLVGSTDGNRLYSPKKGNYKEISDQLKSEALEAAINQQLGLLANSETAGACGFE